MVINKFGARLYDGLTVTVTEHLRDIAAKIEETQGPAFMTELKLRWDDHTKSMQMIRDILMVCFSVGRKASCSIECFFRL
jgi:cullin 3